MRDYHPYSVLVDMDDVKLVSRQTTLQEGLPLRLAARRLDKVVPSKR